MGDRFWLPSPESEEDILLANFACKLCSVLVSGVNDLLVAIRREYEPFVTARIREPIDDLYRAIVTNPKKLEIFKEKDSDRFFRLLGRKKIDGIGSDALGEEHVSSLQILVCNEIVTVDFYTSHPANRLLGSVLATAETVEVEAEIRAHQLLEEHTSEYQYKMYQLTGTLPVRSKKSGKFYLIRRGFPTLVFTVIDHLEEDHYRFELGLCAHTGGYHEGTFASVLCPTDNVIAHLLMLRADEDAFWKASNIHLPTSSRLGL